MHFFQQCSKKLIDEDGMVEIKYPFKLNIWSEHYHTIVSEKEGMKILINELVLKHTHKCSVETLPV